MTRAKSAAPSRTPREQAIDEILELSRGIVSAELAETWARILTAREPGKGKGLTELGLKPRRMDTFYRANFSDPKATGLAVYSIAIAIARHLMPGLDATTDYMASPYHGQGRSAELWTRRAVGVIQQAYGITPVAEEI